MNPKTSHKIVAAGGMAAIIGVGIVMFTMRSHPAAALADTTVPPPPVAQAADAVPGAMGATGSAAAAPASPPDVPAALARDDSSVPAAAVTVTYADPKPVHGRSLSRSGTVATSAPAAGAGVDTAPETVANRVERLRSTDVEATRLTTGAPSVDDPAAGTGVAPAASDSQITTDVKTAIAGDVAVKDYTIGVSTTDGVVALTGSVASQGDIDQVKDVAGKVKDVKRVDTSALILASL